MLMFCQIATAPPGAQAATLDIDAAFRNIPILPAHKPYIVIQGREGEFFIDHVCPFGISSGPGVQGEVMDAVVDILERHNIKPSEKWVDDLFNARFPTHEIAPGVYVYAYDIEDIFRITKRLGVPWNCSSAWHMPLSQSILDSCGTYRRKQCPYRRRSDSNI